MPGVLALSGRNFSPMILASCIIASQRRNDGDDDGCKFGTSYLGAAFRGILRSEKTFFLCRKTRTHLRSDGPNGRAVNVTTSLAVLTRCGSGQGSIETLHGAKRGHLAQHDQL